MSPRILLLPFSFLYGIIIRLRNLLFDAGILSSKSFSFPVIVVGNLSTGGTGKTPHVIYLVNLLKEQFKVATLSRGYGRKTKGFLMADENVTAVDVGDEPMLYYHRFAKSIIVGVGEKRVEAIEKIKTQHPLTGVIILDDAFQHRYVKGGINILLTEFHHPYFNAYLLPAGNLREPRNGMKRADIIIVTKCPDDLNNLVQKTYADKINLLPHQQIFFSGVKYGNLIAINDHSLIAINSLKEYDVLLVTGIANPEPVLNFLKSVCNDVSSLSFADHHPFTLNDIVLIERNFNTIASGKKIIITTEKDAMRLSDAALLSHINKLPFYYLPIEVYFINNQNEFDQNIIKYVTKN